ncbi:MAG: InlB B-repeat-containing protein [Oscillospiraceae bacterium]|nr:InlB B-repeat-containing protein [Oscillospiraceae bacterium]
MKKLLTLTLALLMVLTLVACGTGGGTQNDPPANNDPVTTPTQNDPVATPNGGDNQGGNDPGTSGDNGDNTVNPNATYTVTFNPNGGSIGFGDGNTYTEPYSFEVPHGSVILSPSTYKEKGIVDGFMQTYMFGGWFIDEELTIEWDYGEITSDLTLYAKWED